MTRFVWASLHPKIAEMVAAGATVKQIAVAIDRGEHPLSAEMSRMRAAGLLARAVNTKVRFTARMDDRLRNAIVDRGLSFKDYAREAGISADVVRHRADALGIKSSHAVEIDWETVKPIVIEMRQARASWRQIAKRTGVADSTLRRMSEEIGLAKRLPTVRREPFWNDNRVASVIGMVKRHMTFADIAAEIGNGVTRSAVSGIVVRLKNAGKIDPLDVKKVCQARIKERVASKPKAARAPRPIKPKTVRSLPSPAASRKPLPSFAAVPVSAVELVDFQDLRPGMCRWPIGEVLPFKFCGCRISLGSYCHSHALIAHPAGKVASMPVWSEKRVAA